MLGRTLITAMLIIGADAIATGAQAQEPAAMEAPSQAAPKPAADTMEPGKTATEAVTNPAAAPPSEGSVGTGVPPRTNGPGTGSTPGGMPPR